MSSREATIGCWPAGCWRAGSISPSGTGGGHPRRRRLPAEARPAFVKMLSGVRGFSAAEADRTVLDALAGHQACREYRLAHPLARKIFDMPILTRADRFIILDSDILFFRKPVRSCVGARRERAVLV